MKLRWFLAPALMALAAGLAVLARMGTPEANPAELAKRCEESRPAWASYQEDIKGQIGARPVARWRGQLIEVRQESQSIAATFRLQSPWAEYGADVPVLLRDPMGHEYRQDQVVGEGPERKYVFLLDSKNAASPLPWIEIHFPHTERRVALGTEGRWSDRPTAP